MKSQIEWVDFYVTNGYAEEWFTQDQFEKLVGDEFEAVRLNEKGKPQLIWTKKYVCPVKFEMLEGDLPVMVLQRNP